jgi:hypothetical protein
MLRIAYFLILWASLFNLASAAALADGKEPDSLPKNETHAKNDAERTEAVQLASRQAEGYAYRHFECQWFTLDSTADEKNTKRVVVRAEQAFAAYRRIVPPRGEPAHPPRLVLLGSMEQYQALLGKLGLKTKIENPACFLEDRNVVAIGSDLTGLAVATSKYNAENAQLSQDLQALQQRLAPRLRAVADSLRRSGQTDAEISRSISQERERFMKQIEAKRNEVRQSDRKLDGLFRQCANQTLVRLYHESFHAYLRDCVYPRQKYDVPPWLNEGLAVIFEGGQLQGDTLRVDAPNRFALRKLKAGLAHAPLKLKDLLSAGEGQFLLTAARPPAAVDRYYVHAWGLAYYLAFEKRLLDSAELEKYLQPENSRLDPQQRFEQLTGMPLDQFELKWREYIKAL